MKKMNCILLFSIPILLIQLTPIAVLADSTYANVARCAQLKETTECEISWDYSNRPSMRYDVERLNTDDGKWHVIHRNNAMLLMGSAPVTGGYLYRTKACNGRAPDFAADCVSSNVVWAPVYLPEDEIPSQVVGADGVIMTVSKDGSLSAQLEQYNVYMLVRLLGSNRIDLSELPPMTEVTENDVWADGRFSATQTMQRAFYTNYSGMQRIARQKAQTTSKGDEK